MKSMLCVATNSVIHVLLLLNNPGHHLRRSDRIFVSEVFARKLQRNRSVLEIFWSIFGLEKFC